MEENRGESGGDKTRAVCSLFIFRVAVMHLFLYRGFCRRNHWRHRGMLAGWLDSLPAGEAIVQSDGAARQRPQVPQASHPL